jgi:hypothetical protein
MEPAANKVKRSQPVLPLSLIRKAIGMCLEVRYHMHDKYIHENRDMWLGYGGRLVLEDILSYERDGVYRVPAIVHIRTILLWQDTYVDTVKKCNMDAFEADFEARGWIAYNELFQRDWVDRFKVIEGINKRDLDSMIDDITYGCD